MYRMRHSFRCCSLGPHLLAHLFHGLQTIRGNYFSVSSSLCDSMTVASSRFLLAKGVAAAILSNRLAFLDFVLDPVMKNSEDRPVLRWCSRAGSRWTGPFGAIEKQHLVHFDQGPPLMSSINLTVGYQGVVLLINFGSNWVRGRGVYVAPCK